ncbi:hypothetical protein DH86_00000421, partial [Scytalidium sp. 3C]
VLVDNMSNDSSPPRNVISHTPPPRTEGWQAGIPASSNILATPVPQRPLTIWETSARGVNDSSSSHLASELYSYQYGHELTRPVIEGRRPSSSTSTSTSTGKSSKKSDKSASSQTSRRAQSQDTKRALRARRRIQLQHLRDQVNDLTYRNTVLEAEYSSLQAKYRALLEKFKSDDPEDDEDEEYESEAQQVDSSKAGGKGKGKSGGLSPEEQFVLDLEMEIAHYKDRYKDALQNQGTTSKGS